MKEQVMRSKVFEGQQVREELLRIYIYIYITMGIQEHS